MRDFGSKPNTKICLFCLRSFTVFGGQEGDDFCCRAHAIEYGKAKEIRDFENELKKKQVRRL